MPPGPIFPPGLREFIMDIVLILVVIFGILAFLKSFNKTPSSPISANDNTKGLEGAIEEMTREIRELRKDIKELKEELKE